MMLAMHAYTPQNQPEFHASKQLSQTSFLLA